MDKQQEFLGYVSVTWVVCHAPVIESQLKFVCKFCQLLSVSDWWGSVCVDRFAVLSHVLNLPK